MKKIFSFMMLAVLLLVTGLFFKIVGKETRSKVTWGNLFSIPTAVADVPGGAAEGATEGSSPVGAAEGCAEGCGCEGSSCEGSSAEGCGGGGDG